MIENIKYEKSYLKQLSKLIKKNSITQEQIDKTIELYLKDKNNAKLFYHSICCKRDKHRKSISVIGTNQQYKILLAQYDNM